MIDPTGNFLLVANQNTNNVVIFKRNKTTGLLTPTGPEISIPKPVCLKMVKIGGSVEVLIYKCQNSRHKDQRAVFKD
jgi:DNA-binding beta-propeller fold protein YncE